MIELLGSMMNVIISVELAFLMAIVVSGAVAAAKGELYLGGKDYEASRSTIPSPDNSPQVHAYERRLAA